MYREIIMGYLAQELGEGVSLRMDYPMEAPTSPVVTYSEAANNAYRTFDGEEYLTEYEMQLDIYAQDAGMAEEISRTISQAVGGMGFKRILCNDAAPLDGMRIKQLRFRGIIGPGNVVYQ